MPNESLPVEYVLGIDLGPTSVGWAVIGLERDQPHRVVRAGTRIFDAGVLGDIGKGRDESRATQRRDARGPRRQTWRRQWRLRKVFRLLVSFGLLPPAGEDSPQARHDTMQLLDASLRALHCPKPDRTAAHLLPYRLRANALDMPLTNHAFGRAIYHLAQRRGFKSNLKVAKKDEDRGVVKQGISQLHDDMKRVGARTLGEYFAALDPEHVRIRCRWTARAMFEQEFEAIWQAQSARNATLTDEFKEELRAAIFFQRPLKSQGHLIGKCSLEPRRRRAPLACLAAQRFRILQRVNDLTVITPDGELRVLSVDERSTLRNALDQHGDQSWPAVRKLLGMKKSKVYGRDYVFNFEEGGDKKLIGNRTGASLANVLGDRWNAMDGATQNRLVDDLLSFDDEVALKRRLIASWELSSNLADRVADLGFESGYASLSRRAMRNLQPILEAGTQYATARKAVYGVTDAVLDPMDALPAFGRAFKTVRNPAVSRAASEMRKVVNALIRRYGKPKLIRVEMARDLKHSRDRRQQMTKNRDRNTKAREQAWSRILKEMNSDRYCTEINVRKVLLAEECNWTCPYTDRKIEMLSLVGEHPQFDIEHIVPFSRSLNNSFANLTLCYHEENRRVKQNLTPFEAYGSTERWPHILERVKRFHGDSRQRKLALFETEVQPDSDEFAARLLNDTRYLTVIAREYLGLLYGGFVDQNGSTRVQVSAGRCTAYLRQRWNLNAILGHPDKKDRADHRHHAIDAIVIALTTPAAVQLLSKAAEEAERRGEHRLFVEVDDPWNGFTEDARRAIESIQVSSRVNRRLGGSLHDATILSKPKHDPRTAQKHTHHVRKALVKMSMQEAKNIVDDRVRELVQQRLDAVGGTPDKVFAQPENLPHLTSKRDGRPIPIRKARIRKSGNPIAIGSGVKQRYVSPGDNHHMEIVAVLDASRMEKEWKDKIVSRFEAVTRHAVRVKRGEGPPVVQRDPGGGRKFVFSLARGEQVMMKVGDKEEALYRVESISLGEIEFVLHSDARPTNLRRVTKGARVRCSPDTLRKNGARKVTVDPLGDIHPAGD
jgi:CRISPR-associated endonuclease Csn1